MKNPIVLDTQLFVLLVAGITDRRIIAKHKNLKAYDEDDYDLLLTLLGQDPDLVFIPNIITETSNLLRQHADPERTRLLRVLSRLIDMTAETYVSSASAVRQPGFLRLGITDAAVIELCRTQYSILTADADLYIEAASRGLSAINFNHKREEFGLL